MCSGAQCPGLQLPSVMGHRFTEYDSGVAASPVALPGWQRRFQLRKCFYYCKKLMQNVKYFTPKPILAKCQKYSGFAWGVNIVDHLLFKSFYFKGKRQCVAIDFVVININCATSLPKGISHSSVVIHSSKGHTEIYRAIHSKTGIRGALLS